MNTIIVKVNDATQTISQVDVVTKDGIPTVITATDKVNYEFFDTAINHAPNHIITKRLNNDLHVSFEEAAQETDLIIEGFYDSEDSALLGIAEDGEYYYYIPDTGETYDYVTQLEAGDVEGQALGGEEYIAAAVLPWWIPAAAGIGLVGLIAGRDSDDDNDFNDDDTVNADAPVATDDSVTTVIDTPVTQNIIGNDDDANGDSLTVDDFTVDGTTYQPGETATITGVGTITVTEAGDLTFTPETGYAGSVPDVDYTVIDGNGGSDTGTVTFTDIANQPPVATDDSVTTVIDTPVTQNIIGNDDDANGDSLTVDDFTVDGTTYQPGETATITGVGTITVTEAGDLTFTPETGYAGSVPDVDYTVIDGNGGSDTGTVTFTDIANQPPVATDDSVTTVIDTPVTQNIIGNDDDANGDSLTVDDFTVDGTTYQPGETATITGVGTITVTEAGDLTFTPETGYAGSVPDVDYTVIDGNGGSDTDTGTVTFTDIANQPPVATDDSVTTVIDTPVTQNIIGNDDDANGDSLTVDDFTVDGTTYQPGETATITGVGTITVTEAGDLTFTPETGYAGSVPDVDYTVIDGNGGSDTGTVTFTDIANQPPVATDDSVTTVIDTPVTQNIIGNDDDANGDSLTVDDFTVDGTTYQPGETATITGVGTITVTEAGDLTFTPETGYAGSVPDVDYTVIDGNGGSDTGTVTFTDIANQPPVATDDSVTTVIDTPVTQNIIGNDDDANGDSLTVDDFTVDGTTYQPGETATITGVGTITVTEAGDLTFTPETGYAGSVPDVDYTVIDGNGGSDTGTVTFTDIANQPPVATDDSVTTVIDTPVTQNIIGNDDDANGDSLTVDDFTVDGTTYQPGETATITGVGTITVTEAGDLTFTPETGYAGSVPDVDYTVIDGNGGSDTGTVTFTDIANQPPVATDDSVTGTTAMAVVVDVLGNDSDSNDDIDPTSVKLIDASGVEVTTLTVAGEGEWVVDAATGDVTFTPEGSFTGDPTPVEYVVSDTTGEKSAPATITVDYPTDAVDDSVSMQEDSDTISGNVLDNDKTGLTVTAIQIAGTDYSVGTAVDIPNVGTVQIDADGAYSFTPVEDYSGEVPDITYTVSDGTTTDTANLDIEVTAVADQPTTGSFELDPPGLVLNYQSWSNAKSVNGQNLLANKGSGASEEVLIGAIDDLRSGGVTANDDSTAVTDNGIITTTSLVATDLPEYDAVYISGYVFLEAGETYMYSGSGDDSASIVIGDNVSSLHVNWRGTNTSGNGEFDVTESGYYSFQFYAHNADGIGNYDFTIQNTDGTTEMKYYQDLSAIEGSLAGTSYILGDYDAGVDGSDDTGFYSVSRGYEGASADSIELIGINLQTTDTDGSEYLSFEMAGLPAGAILTFQDALGNEHSVTTDANGTASYTPTVSDAGTTEYSDFTLTVGDTIASSLDVSLVVTSTETLNGDSSTSTLDFEVEVTNASSSDDTIVFNADSTSMNGGDGTDTLLIDVDGTSIDFSNFNSSAFESLEVIDMTGNGTQALTNLTTSDVLEITNETVMTDKGLIINGDSADSVSLSGSDWTSAGTTTQDSNTYNVYSFADTDGTHELLIQTDITTTVL